MKKSATRKVLDAIQARGKMLLFALALTCCWQGIQAHGVQIGFCVLPNGFLRVYVEHWHGDITTQQIQSGLVAPMSITTTVGGTPVTQTQNAIGGIPNTSFNSLPGCGANIQILQGCPGLANTYNDWLYWDFPPAACNQPVTVVFNAGLNAITTEACGQLYPQTFNTTFSDQGPPTITCPDMDFTSCDPVTVNAYNVSVTDDCDPNPSVTISPAAPQTFNPGSTPVTVTATDNLNQTSTCTFNVNVNPLPQGCNLAPNAVCQNLTVNADGNCQGVASAAQFDGGSTDPDGDPLTFTVSPAGPYALGTTNVTLTVSDGTLSATCSASITVQDNTPPAIACTTNVNISTDAGQCCGTLGAGATVVTGTAQADITLTPGPNNQGGVAYNPILDLYYKVRAGSSGYILYTYDANGNTLASNTAGFDFRGLWWNPNTNQLQGNGFSSNGYRTVTLDANGYATSSGSNVSGQNQPNSQSVGDYDYDDNEVIFYANGNIHRYNISTGASLGSYAITGLPTFTSSLTNNVVGYSGIAGQEIMVYDRNTKRVYFIDKSTGAYQSTVQLPATAAGPSSFNVSFANNRIFIS
ncbi:MAG: hypothetical protein AAF570_08910, partial [Bacteroidota bacterium]